MFQKSIADGNKIRQFYPPNLLFLFLNLKHSISKPETPVFIYFNDLGSIPFLPLYRAPGGSLLHRKRRKPLSRELFFRDMSRALRGLRPPGAACGLASPTLIGGGLVR